MRRQLISILIMLLTAGCACGQDALHDALSECVKDVQQIAVANGEAEQTMKVPEGPFDLRATTQALNETIPFYAKEIGADIIEACGAGTWADGSPIKVAVLDTGCDETHRSNDLKQVKEVFDVTGSRYGWRDRNGHGTHVIGSISANGQLKTICPKAEVWSYKCLGDSGSGSVAGIASCYRHARENGIEFTNASLGGSFSRTIEDECQKAEEAGLINYSSIGNSGARGDGHPGNSEYTRGVGAIDNNDRAASFSSHSSVGHLTGRGVNTLSTWPGGRYNRISGTSMSGPVECAKGMLAAGYFDRVKGRKPTPAELIEWTKPYMRDLGPRGFDRVYFNGHLDLAALVKANPIEDQPTDPTDPPGEEPTECEKLLVELREAAIDTARARERYKTAIEALTNFELAN